MQLSGRSGGLEDDGRAECEVERFGWKAGGFEVAMGGDGASLCLGLGCFDWGSLGGGVRSTRNM